MIKLYHGSNAPTDKHTMVRRERHTDAKRNGCCCGGHRSSIRFKEDRQALPYSINNSHKGIYGWKAGCIHTSFP